MTSFASRDRSSPSSPLHEKRVIRLTAFSLSFFFLFLSLSLSFFLSLCVCPTDKSAFREKRAFLAVIFINYVTRIIPRNRIHLNIQRLWSFNSWSKKGDVRLFPGSRSVDRGAWYHLGNSMPPRPYDEIPRNIHTVLVSYRHIDIDAILQPTRYIVISMI